MTTTVRTIFSINATDRSHDFLVIRRGPAGISIEAQSREDEWESATAGPFTPEQLRAALDEVASAGSYTRTDEDTPEQYREAWQAAERAVLDEREMRKEAEKERDHLATVLATTARQRDEAYKSNAHRLAPDAITDEMVERAAKSRPGPNEWSHDIMRRILIAALTEPPARPVGAEELAQLIATADVGEWDCGDLADALLATGRVRVVTEEQQ